MATLSQVIAHKVGNETAGKLIQEGSVKVNGIVDTTDHMLYPYDIVEFSDRKLCYVGFNFLVEADEQLH